MCLSQSYHPELPAHRFSLMFLTTKPCNQTLPAIPPLLGRCLSLLDCLMRLSLSLFLYPFLFCSSFFFISSLTFISLQFCKSFFTSFTLTEGSRWQSRQWEFNGGVMSKCSPWAQWVETDLLALFNMNPIRQLCTLEGSKLCPVPKITGGVHYLVVCDFWTVLYILLYAYTEFVLKYL